MSKKAASYVVDLNKTEGEGNFPCPHEGCGATIDPEDESKTVYKIRETIMKDNNLKTLIIDCLKCDSEIRLTGFLDKYKFLTIK